MAEALTLFGFQHSVYTWAARFGLHEMGLRYSYTEADPFADPPDPTLSAVTPFGRVPVLRHGEFRLTETAAILRYLADLSGADLVPADPRAAARMTQIIGVIDAYGYWPLVRDVFSHGFYRPHFGLEADPARITSGLVAAQPVLALLEQIAREGLQLTESRFSLADIHLAPMLGYFASVPEGAEMLAQHSRLSVWWKETSARPYFTQTNPLSQR